MNSSSPVIGIVMGSNSDWPTMQAAAKVLKDFGVPFEARVVSAHRTPDLMFEYAEQARARGVKTGGDIMIHGQPNQIPDGFKVKGDWTAGCIAMARGDLIRLAAELPPGAELIVPALPRWPARKAARRHGKD